MVAGEGPRAKGLSQGSATSKNTIKFSIVLRIARTSEDVAQRIFKTEKAVTSDVANCNQPTLGVMSDITCAHPNAAVRVKPYERVTKPMVQPSRPMLQF